MKKSVIYLDFAAATPVDNVVLAAMLPYFSEKFYNPSATYLVASSVKQDLQAARETIARCLGARPSEIIFTAGGTEANNLAISGVMNLYPKSNVVASAIEHESVLAPAATYGNRVIKADQHGVIDLANLQKQIDDKTVLVSIMYANNEIGTIEPLRKISLLLREIRKQRQELDNSLPLYFHTDACQAANYLDLHVSRLGVDMMTINGGKMYGPKQSGALYVRTGIDLSPLILGGGQERGLRSGTENVVNSIGLAKALEITQNIRDKEVKRLKVLQKLFIIKLTQSIPSARINGSLKTRLPNNIHITLAGTDNERLMMQLDEAGIQSAVGSACSASNDEPSHVLAAIGLNQSDAQASLRFTMGRTTTNDHITRTIDVLANCL